MAVKILGVGIKEDKEMNGYFGNLRTGRRNS